MRDRSSVRIIACPVVLSTQRSMRAPWARGDPRTLSYWNCNWHCDRHICKHFARGKMGELRRREMGMGEWAEEWGLGDGPRGMAVSRKG
eukprot:10077998-Alexandrium_andersonii.AAC.1